MASLHSSGGFSVTGLVTGLALFAGLAMVGAPWVGRQIAERARGARAAAEKIETGVGADLDRFALLTSAFGQAALELRPVGPGPEPPPPVLPASPVERVPEWFPPLRRPPPLGIPEWRPWRRRGPPFAWRMR